MDWKIDKLQIDEQTSSGFEFTHVCLIYSEVPLQFSLFLQIVFPTLLTAYFYGKERTMSLVGTQ